MLVNHKHYQNNEKFGSEELGFYYTGHMVWLQKPTKRTILVSCDNFEANIYQEKVTKFFLSLPSMVYLLRYSEFEKPPPDEPEKKYVRRNKFKVGFLNDWSAEEVYMLPFPNTYFDGSVCLGRSSSGRSTHPSTLETLMRESISDFWSIPFRVGEVDENWWRILGKTPGMPPLKNTETANKSLMKFLTEWESRTRQDPSYIPPAEIGIFSSSFDSFESQDTSR